VRDASGIGGSVAYQLAGCAGLAGSDDLGDRLSQRPSSSSDHEFLLTLFAESRPELALLPEEVRTQLTRMQFDSQLSQYRSSAPDAVDWVLELEHIERAEPVGRCYLQQGLQEHRLLDLAIRRQWRRRGLAGIVLTRLCAGAAQAGVPLRLSVWQANHDALRLYHRHGFITDDADSGYDRAAPGLAGYLRLRWSAERFIHIEEEAR
jgi:GNAT superfamily N-acetyltransferase